MLNILFAAARVTPHGMPGQLLFRHAATHFFTPLFRGAKIVR